MKVNLLGVRIDNLSFSECLDKGVELMENGQGRVIVTPNPEFLVYAGKEAKFKEILNQADLAIPDGIGLIWASRMLGNPLRERVAGVDLAEKLVARAAERGLTVFLIGGRGNVAEQAAKRLKDRYSGLKIIGALPGEPVADRDEETRGKLGSSKIALLLVAYGHPKQEFWIDRNLKYLQVNVAMGVGGAFDFWSGQTKRAPGWVRAGGLEWLFRLLREPWRIRRQLALPTFVWLVLKQYLVR